MVFHQGHFSNQIHFRKFGVSRVCAGHLGPSHPFSSTPFPSSPVFVPVLICDLLHGVFKTSSLAFMVCLREEVTVKGFIHARQVGSFIWRRDTLTCVVNNLIS